jgi:hypothetical protein
MGGEGEGESAPTTSNSACKECLAWPAASIGTDAQFLLRKTNKTLKYLPEVYFFVHFSVSMVSLMRWLRSFPTLGSQTAGEVVGKWPQTKHT